MDNNIIYYFGTSLTQAGHYIWEVKNNTLSELNTYSILKRLPFNPENLNNNLPNGNIIFYQGGGYTVIGITGSCKDTRPSSKSIFFINKIVSFNELKELLLSIPIVNKMIEQMTFNINWDYGQ